MNEKDVEVSSADSLQLTDADEALELVGVRRTAEFSEEYMLKLRRKLVGCRFRWFRLKPVLITSETGLDDTSTLCSGVFHAVPVSF